MIAALLRDKSLKPKEKTELLCNWLLEGKLAPEALLEFASSAKDPAKATCIEALEFALQKNDKLVGDAEFRFVTEALTSTAPRVKWESAKVIARVAAHHQSDLEPAITNLLVNTEHEGTVVRWSAATALGAILLLKTNHNDRLRPALETLRDREEKDSIRKIYAAALGKV